MKEHVLRSRIIPLNLPLCLFIITTQNLKREIKLCNDKFRITLDLVKIVILFEIELYIYIYIYLTCFFTPQF